MRRIRAPIEIAVKWLVSSRLFAGGFRLQRSEHVASLVEDGALQPLTQTDVEEMLDPMLRRRSELKAKAKKLNDMARQYQAVGKIDQRALNSMATIDLRATDAMDEVTRLHDLLLYEDASAKDRVQKVVTDLREARDAIDQALDRIKDTRQLIIDGKFFR